MKKVLSKWSMTIIASMVICLSTVHVSQAQGSVSLQVFYDELQPYGSWIDHNNYGYVWMPNVDAGFSPYATNGYWVNTAYGNTWVSDYSWGWAPFHYGRWFFDDHYGWLWVPDTTWAPAWVTWRSGGGYYGWAPLMPGFGISVSVGYYNRIPHNYWNFVPCRYVMYRNVYRHRMDRPQVVNIINNTTIINNYHDNGNGRNGRDRDDRSYFTGPSRSDIEQRNHERVPVYEVSDRSRPGRTEVGRNSVSMYKPQVENSSSGRTRAMPSNTLNDERLDRNGRTGTVETSRDGAMPRNMRESQLRDSRANDENRIQRTTPLERNSRSFGETNTIERSNRTETPARQQNNQRQMQDYNVERMQRQPAEQRMEREQRVEQMQRTPAPSNRSQMQTQPLERSNGMNSQRTTTPREFNNNSQMRQQQPQRSQSVERSSSPQMQRQPQVQRNSSGTRSAETSRRRSN